MTTVSAVQLAALWHAYGSSRVAWSKRRQPPGAVLRSHIMMMNHVMVHYNVGLVVVVVIIIIKINGRIPPCVKNTV